MSRVCYGHSSILKMQINSTLENRIIYNINTAKEENLYNHLNRYTSKKVLNICTRLWIEIYIYIYYIYILYIYIYIYIYIERERERQRDRETERDREIGLCRRIRNQHVECWNVETFALRSVARQRSHRGSAVNSLN